MKRLFITAALLLGTVLSAHADQLVIRWYDTMRPHGHRRADAIGEAAVDLCNRTVSVQYTSVSPAFKACMRRQGYRFVPARMRRTRGTDGVTVYNRDSRDPNVGWHTEGGWRVCHNDCDNPEIPGSGYTCRNVEFMGMAMRRCDK